MMTKHSKRFNEATGLVEADKKYNPSEAIAKVKETANSRFDETIELHLRTNADPRHADQQLRGTATLPAGLGKAVRVAVFANGEGARGSRARTSDASPAPAARPSRNIDSMIDTP